MLVYIDVVSLNVGVYWCWLYIHSYLYLTVFEWWKVWGSVQVRLSTGLSGCQMSNRYVSLSSSCLPVRLYVYQSVALNFCLSYTLHVVWGRLNKAIVKFWTVIWINSCKVYYKGEFLSFLLLPFSLSFFLPSFFFPVFFETFFFSLFFLSFFPGF